MCHGLCCFIKRMFKVQETAKYYTALIHCFIPRSLIGVNIELFFIFSSQVLIQSYLFVNSIQVYA